MPRATRSNGGGYISRTKSTNSTSVRCPQIEMLWWIDKCDSVMIFHQHTGFRLLCEQSVIGEVQFWARGQKLNSQQCMPKCLSVNECWKAGSWSLINTVTSSIPFIDINSCTFVLWSHPIVDIRYITEFRLLFMLSTRKLFSSGRHTIICNTVISWNRFAGLSVHQTDNLKLIHLIIFPRPRLQFGTSSGSNCRPLIDDEDVILVMLDGINFDWIHSQHFEWTLYVPYFL